MILLLSRLCASLTNVDAFGESSNAARARKRSPVGPACHFESPELQKGSVSVD